MQVEVDVKCMKTKFRGHGPSGFRDFAPFCLPSKMVEFYFESWTIIHVLTSKTKINIAANIFGFSFSECDIITFSISFSFSGQTMKILVSKIISSFYLS